MALETLKNIDKIGECDVVVMDELRERYPEKFNESGSMDYKWFEEHVRPKNFIYIRHDKNSLSFTLQNGPVKEVGVNGCQVDEIIIAAGMIIRGLNKKFPCEYNKQAINSLNDALNYLEDRRADRTNRNVEGINKV